MRRRRLPALMCRLSWIPQENSLVKPRLYAAAFAFAAASFSGQAQIAAGIGGRIADPSGAAVSGAELTLTNSNTSISQTASSTSAGDYLFAGVNPGVYSLAVTARGFQRLERSGLTLAL